MAFQVIGHQGLRYDEAYPVSRFDKTSIKWDLYYFKYYFLHVSGLSYDEQELEKGFDILANAIVQEDTDFFMYRDFQARNIMVKDGKLRYIDYQGGRMGHPLYDVVSLLYQARAGLSEALRNDLFGYYLDEIHKNYSVTTSRFPAVYPYLKLLRFLQVLGAYGFRGRIQRKSHFLKSIPHALENLHNLITAPDFPSELATLANILKNMIAESRKSEAQKTGSLNILVYSFSYKKAGMLSDSSGNGGGFVFDCRSLPNPGRYEAFKYLTGKDAPVISFLEARQEVQDFIDQSFQVVMPSIENYLSRGFEHLMVGFGCTGGQHRSVFCAEKFAEAIRQKYALSVTVKHYQQDQENNNSGKKS
jgi:hypothetical protein